MAVDMFLNLSEPHFLKLHNGAEIAPTLYGYKKCK